MQSRLAVHEHLTVNTSLPGKSDSIGDSLILIADPEVTSYKENSMADKTISG
jgi:hypothetical protein